MINGNLSWSFAGIASVLALGSILNGCGSDDAAPAAVEAGTGGKSGTGGRRATGGSTSTSGTTGSGGAAGAATCSVSFGTTCDGAEDCPTGQRCCGRLGAQGMAAGGIRYVEMGCHASCTALGADGGVMGTPSWFEICHAGDTCEESTATCLTSPYLPDGLARCLPSGVMSSGDPPDATLGKDKNAVNCGSKVCGASEQCCVRQPLEPYCAPKSATCACTEPDAGAGDGGKQPDGSAEGSAPDATPDGSATPDATPPADASDAQPG